MSLLRFLEESSLPSLELPLGFGVELASLFVADVEEEEEVLLLLLLLGLSGDPLSTVEVLNPDGAKVCEE